MKSKLVKEVSEQTEKLLVILQRAEALKSDGPGLFQAPALPVCETWEKLLTSFVSQDFHM